MENYDDTFEVDDVVELPDGTLGTIIEVDQFGEWCSVRRHDDRNKVDSYAQYELSYRK